MIWRVKDEDIEPKDLVRKPLRGHINVESCPGALRMINVVSVERVKFESLTEKQRLVMELLIQHKTSKEIARELRISPHTVDQRINFSKQKLDVGSRGELATAYRRLKDVYEQSIYDESHIDRPAISFETIGTNDASGYLLSKKTDKLISPSQELDHRVVPEIFEGRFRVTSRVLAIVLTATLLVILGLGGLAIFSQLSEMLNT